MKRRKHILITGSHRSGSTWVGKTICNSNKFVYVDEPFNIGKDHKNSPFRNQFEYLAGLSTTEQTKAKSYLNSFHSIFHDIMLSKLLGIRSRKDGRRFLTEINSRLNRRYVFKDPLALMSAEWLYKTYGWNVVVLIRHPAAFVASLKVKDWQFYFQYFNNQQALISEHLEAYAKEINSYTANRPDIIKQGILLWNILYSMVQYYQNKYSNEWYFIKHEDLSNEPLREFEDLYQFLDIDFDTSAKERIVESTSGKESSLLKRDSKKNLTTWKDRLTRDEIDLIYKETKEVWKYYYSEDDW